VRGLAELREAVPGVQPLVVVNKVRESAVPGGAEQQARAALRRYAGVEDVLVVPADVQGLDRALAVGRTLAEAAPGSPARAAVAGHVAGLLGVSRPAKGRGRRRVPTRR
jgi:Flp pilus assembly CpaE family ATPase